MMKTITSLQNERVKYTVSLHDARQRRDMSAFLVEGERACEPFFEHGFDLQMLWVTREHEVWALSLGIDEDLVYLTTDQLMRKMSTAVTPSGILAVFSMPEEKPLKLEHVNLVLANLQDPGNVGTLIRTAQAFGVPVIAIEGADIFGPKVVQASAGALAQRKVTRCSWQEFVLEAADQKVQLSALVVSGGAAIESASTAANRALIVGNEAQGLSDKQLADCQERFSIAMPGGTESLNAAVAGSIALYALTRRCTN